MVRSRRRRNPTVLRENRCVRPLNRTGGQQEPCTGSRRAAWRLFPGPRPPASEGNAVNHEQSLIRAGIRQAEEGAGRHWTLSATVIVGGEETMQNPPPSVPDIAASTNRPVIECRSDRSSTNMNCWRSLGRVALGLSTRRGTSDCGGGTSLLRYCAGSCHGGGDPAFRTGNPRHWKCGRSAYRERSGCGRMARCSIPGYGTR